MPFPPLYAYVPVEWRLVDVVALHVLEAGRREPLADVRNASLPIASEALCGGDKDVVLASLKTGGNLPRTTTIKAS